MIATVITAIVVFAATNIDDIVLLSAFFADATYGTRAVVIGQFVGILVLTLVSALAGLLAVTIPAGWIGLLGFAPLVLGLRGFYFLWRDRGLEPDAASSPLMAATRRSHRWMAIALVTVANGGDNLGVYIPLFARTPSSIPLYAVVFIALTGVWCLVGHWVVSRRAFGRRIRQYGHIALPIVLTAIGLTILADARSLIR